MEERAVLRRGSKPLLPSPPNDLAPQFFPFPWPPSTVTLSKLTEGWMQDLTVDPFPSHHQQLQPPLPCSAECQPSPSRSCAMKHPGPPEAVYAPQLQQMCSVPCTTFPQ